MRRFPYLVAVLVPGIVLAAAVGWIGLKGPDPTQVPTLQEVTSRTISPYCAPLTLAECPSPKAAELREEIRDRIEAGWTNERLDEWLTSNFGAWVDGNPGDAVAPLLPAVSILLGSIAIAFFLRRRESAASTKDVEGAPEELEQFASELAEFRMASE